MKQNTEKNYYELLNIHTGATEQEIEAAYQRVNVLYSEGSVAAYSLYSQEERKSLLSVIGKAYETLKDPLKRTAYNAKMPNLSPEGHRHNDVQPDTGHGNTDKDYPEIRHYKPSVSLKKPLSATDDAELIIAEQYRILCTKLEQISFRNSYKTFAVTSAVKGEGKTVTSLNLAYIMARDFKKKVVVVECDLRNPSFASYVTQPEHNQNLIEVLRGDVDLTASIAQVEDTSMYVLPARQESKNAIELISSQRMRTILQALKAEFDYVLIDTPPILPVADMNIIARISDGLIIVVRAGKTPKDIVKKAVNSIHNASIVGIVLNGATPSIKQYYY